jgi:AcrR family transcriptional regulator
MSLKTMRKPCRSSTYCNGLRSIAAALSSIAAFIRSSKKSFPSPMSYRIFEAVLQELAVATYVNFSIERVAARAGTSKPVIYRRWPTRARLVYAALKADRPVLSFEVPDTGTVRDDIMVILHRVSEIVDELSPEAVFGLIAELLHESDSSLFEEVHERSIKIMMEILARGVGRGEIAAEKLTPRLAALPFDLARHQLVLLQQPLSAQDIEEIVDRIFLPLVRANSAGGLELDGRPRRAGRRSKTSPARSAIDENGDLEHED